MAAEWHALHPKDPQRRLLDKAAARLRAGAVIVYPTDSCYALGCRVGDNTAADRIRAIRRFGRHHLFTVMCRDLSDIGTYGRVDNMQFGLLKSLTPGPYTFVLRASPEAPRRLLHEKRKTLGLRLPDHRVTQALLAAVGEPLLSCTLTLPGDEMPIADPLDARARLDPWVDVVVHSGNCGHTPTTVIDLSEGAPRLLRAGKGDVSALFPDTEPAAGGV